MKWARVIKNPVPDIPGQDDQDFKNDLICFRDYGTEDELKADLECGENQWVHYKFRYDYGLRVKMDYKDQYQKNNAEFQKNLSAKVNEYIESFKKRYEVFCGGYLFFYDERVRYGTIDHIIHFKWDIVTDKKGNTEFSVIIYLSPKPEKKRRSNLQKGKQQVQTGKAIQQKANALMVRESSTAGFNGPVDPPPPPPPPPPTLH